MSKVARIVVLMLCLVASVRAADRSAAPQRPNIVYILADDLGYGDVHCLNPTHGKIATPNIDKLAAQGMTFTDAHSSSAVCTPSRYSILTGRYNWRSHLQHGVLGGMSPPLIAADRLTVAGLLKQHGYATACFGKWHLGMDMPKPITQGAIKEGPTTRGFDHFFGISASADMPPYAFIENNHFTEAPTLNEDLYRGRKGPTAPHFKMEDILPTLIDKSTQWIDQHKGGPFFVYLALNAPHTPLAPSKQFKGRSGLGDYGDYVMETDWAVGRVLDELDKAGVANNTLVIMTSDNGCAPYIGTAVTTPRLSNQGQGAVATLVAKGHYPSAQFRGYKSDAWDGGHRIPFIARWPAVVKAGSTCPQMICEMDLMATSADMIDAKVPEHAGEDSVSFLSLLRGSDKPVRTWLVHHSIAGKFAIRDGKWKLLLCPGSGGWDHPKDAEARKEGLPPIQLYDMSEDESEHTNVQAEHADLVKTMTDQLEKIVADGRSTPGPDEHNDVKVDIFKKGK